jgi:hypothetical protein
MNFNSLSIHGSDGIRLPNGYRLTGINDRVLGSAYATAGPAVQTITSLTPVAITGLSITYTPISSTSTILIFSNICHTCTNYVSFGVFKDGVTTVSTTGQTNNNEANMQVTYYIGNDATLLHSSHVMHYETSGSTVARTYTIRTTGSTGAGVATTLYINNRNTTDMATFSQMVLMEVL